MKKLLIASALVMLSAVPAYALCGGNGLFGGMHERRQSRIDNRHARRSAGCASSATSSTMTTTTRTTFRARGGVVTMSAGACANGQCDAPQTAEKVAPPTKTK